MNVGWKIQIIIYVMYKNYKISSNCFWFYRDWRPTWSVCTTWSRSLSSSAAPSRTSTRSCSSRSASSTLCCSSDASSWCWDGTSPTSSTTQTLRYNKGTTFFNCFKTQNIFLPLYLLPIFDILDLTKLTKSSILTTDCWQYSPGVREHSEYLPGRVRGVPMGGPEIPDRGNQLWWPRHGWLGSTTVDDLCLRFVPRPNPQCAFLQVGYIYFKTALILVLMDLYLCFLILHYSFHFLYEILR